MNRILCEVTSWLILLGLPGVVVIYLCGHSLLTVIYGARYVAAAGPLAVAAGVVFLNILNVASRASFRVWAVRGCIAARWLLRQWSC